MLYVVIAFIIIIGLFSVFRLRQGGPGPAVNYVPRGMRGRLNSAYRRAGWQQPYDENGDRSPDRTQV